MPIRAGQYRNAAYNSFDFFPSKFGLKDAIRRKKDLHIFKTILDMQRDAVIVRRALRPYFQGHPLTQDYKDEMAVAFKGLLFDFTCLQRILHTRAILAGKKYTFKHFHFKKQTLTEHWQDFEDDIFILNEYAHFVWTGPPMIIEKRKIRLPKTGGWAIRDFRVPDMKTYNENRQRLLTIMKDNFKIKQDRLIRLIYAFTGDAPAKVMGLAMGEWVGVGDWEK
jgi:hypothetical protein